MMRKIILIILDIFFYFLEFNDPNPVTNSKLASIIEMAKKNSMPKESILNAIKTHVCILFNY